MSAKLISGGGNLHLIHNSDQRKPIFPTSHLAFTTNISKPIKIRRKFSIIKTSSKSSKPAASGGGGRGPTVNAFYVPTQTTPETFYDLLGISESVTFSEIKKAYKQMARKYHPDVSPPERMEEYTQKFILVHEAYETLSNPQSRAGYDLDLARGLHLPFSSTRRSASGESSDEEWKQRWQSQLNELKKRTVNENSTGKGSSWGARMRRQRNTIF